MNRKLSAELFHDLNDGITSDEAEVLKRVLAQTFMMMVFDINGAIIEINAPYLKILNYSLEEVQEQGYRGLFREAELGEGLEMKWEALTNGKKWAGKLSKRTKDKKDIWLQSMIFPIEPNGSVPAQFLEISLDITAQKAAEKWEAHACHHELTNLPNRRKLHLLSDSFLERAKVNKEKLAVLFMDINQFKTINDSYGHFVGDLFLKEVASRLTSCLDEKAHVFHLSGDEFIVVIEDGGNVDAYVEAIISQFNRPFSLSGYQFYAGISVGISLYPDHSTEFNTLLEYADRAMFKSKKNIESQYHMYHRNDGEF